MTAPQPAAPAETQRPAGVDTLTPSGLPVAPVVPPGPSGPSAPDAAGRPPVRRPSRAAAVRTLASAVVGSVLAGYAAVVALVSLLSSTANADWSLGTTLRSAAPLWLAVHQVPLTITLPGGAPASLGVLPLLPTLGLAVLVARAAAGVTARLDWHTPGELAILAAAFAGSTAVLGVAIALAEPTSSMTASPVAAAAGCAATAGLSALWGGLRAVGFSRVALALVPPWAVRGVLAGLAGLVALLAAGALFTFGGLVLSAGTVREVLGSWSGAPGGRFGVTVLSIAYLPNAIIGAMSWTMGPGLSVGAVSVTLFGTSAGALPPVPLLAALPEPGPAPWRVLVFVLPLLAGLLVARRCRRLSTATAADLGHADLGHADPDHADTGHADLAHANLGHSNLDHTGRADAGRADLGHAGRADAGRADADHADTEPSGLADVRRTDRLHAVVTAGVVTAAGCFVLAILAGGRLGGGAFDPVRIPSASLAIAAFVWIVLPAGIVVGLRDRSSWRLPDPHAAHFHPDVSDPDHPYADDADPDRPYADDSDLDHPYDADPDHPYAGGGHPDHRYVDDADHDHPYADDADHDDADTGHAHPRHIDHEGIDVEGDPDDVDAGTDLADDSADDLDGSDWPAGDHVDETVVWYAAGHDDDPWDTSLDGGPDAGTDGPGVRKAGLLGRLRVRLGGRRPRSAPGSTG